MKRQNKRVLGKMQINLKHALIELKFGILNGFPLCCIIHYCMDTLLDREGRRIKRHIRGLNRNGYVPCVLCFRAHKQTYQHAITEMFLETGYLEDKDYWLLPKHVKALVFNPPSF